MSVIPNAPLRFGSTWDEIGRAIGWSGEAAEKHYRRRAERAAQSSV